MPDFFLPFHVYFVANTPVKKSQNLILPLFGFAVLYLEYFFISYHDCDPIDFKLHNNFILFLRV